MTTKCVITAGGTGGHLFPAQALASNLQDKGIEIIFLAKGLQENHCFSKNNFLYFDVDAAPFAKNPFLLCRNLWKIGKGVVQALSYLRDFKPDLVIGFGSYHTLSVLLAARMLAIPIVLHEANAYPGKVNRLFSRGAVWTGVFFNQAKDHLKAPVEIVSIPLRQEFDLDRLPSQQEAIERYGLQKNKKTIVIFGGSQGARHINELAMQAASFLPKNSFQVIHFVGNSMLERVKQGYAEAGIESYVASFESNMPQAYRAADLVVSRAGASTIAELLHCQVPSVLIPFPFAADNHQLENGRYVEQVVEGGILLPEAGLTARQLASSILNAAEDSSLKKMRENIRSHISSYSRKDFSEAVLSTLQK